MRGGLYVKQEEQMIDELKKLIGYKVRRLREERELTRESLGGDGSQLSVRQLARIESGEALPKLEKVAYIANSLGVEMKDIVDPSQVVLPEKYIALKNKITTYHTYEDPEREKQRDKWLKIIKTDYYDTLTEEEQVWFRVLEAFNEVAKTYDTIFAEPVLKDYFEQAIKKDKYNINDLQLISLYFFVGI